MTPNTRHAATNATARPTLIPADTGDWRDDAQCRRYDPDLCYPTGNQYKLAAGVARAKRVCGRCAVRPQCLEWALSTDQRSGVWGGLTAAERRTLFRDRIDRGRSYELCIEQQEFIEQRLAAGATHRVIADELGVGHSAVGRACRFFEAERAAQEVAA